jgi:hypothetical protein
MENMERKLLDKLSSVEKNLMVLQEKSELNDKNSLIKMINLENKLETTVEISQQNQMNYSSKIQSLDSIIRENEIKLKELMEKHQQTVSELSFFFLL